MDRLEVRVSALLVLAAFTHAGCHLILRYDTEPPDGAVDAPGAGDFGKTDGARHDVKGTKKGDMGKKYRPIAADELHEVWSTIRVPCVKKDGTQTASQIPIIDDKLPYFAAGPSLLDGAPQETLDWIGPLPWVIIVWDPNACEYEDWNSSEKDSDWGSAGLLVRRAALVQKKLQLGSQLTVKDINLIDTSYSTGKLKDEVVTPTDAELQQTFPQLVMPVNAAKEAVIKTALSPGPL